MKPDQPLPEDYTRPVAYDVQGQPLYAHPPATPLVESATPVVAPSPQVVHMSRPAEPMRQAVSPEVKLKHDRSTLHYPTLNLSESEFIISAVKRHLIGLFAPLAVGALLVSMALSVLFNYDLMAQQLNLSGAAASPLVAIAFILPFVLIVVFGMFVTYYVYTNNKFFLTNESVIQEIQISLFSKREQTVSLSNVEDASYAQQGLLQQLLNYGSIRLSTEGDETTYRFTYVANPKQHIARLNNAVEAFKNGRPVSDD